MDFNKLYETLNKALDEVELKPYKFTIDYDDGRPETVIEYGMDAEDAKQNLLKDHKYLQDKPERISDGELVPEDHEEVTLPFTMTHRSSEGPDASGEVTFFPTAFGYEYQCTEKDFNGKGPQWSTIRTIEGIKIWFRNVLFEFGAKTVTIGDETWDIDDFPKNEDIQLVDKADPDFQLGDAYIAKNKEDLINGLDKLTFGDTIGAFVNYLDMDGVTGELNVEMVDEDLFKISMEEYTKENADDWEGKDVLDTEFLTKEETINQLNLILEHWEIVEKLDESLKDYKEIGKILQNKENGGFNVAEGNDPMLLKDEPTLKELLNNLAKYL